MKPDPNATSRSHLGKARQNIANGGNDSLIGMEADFAISVASDEADRQLAACRLVADSAIYASPQHVQFGFAHRAFESQQGAIIEHGRMINAVGIADQRVGKSSQINQAAPFGVVAREPRDFETEHQTDARERHFRGEAGKQWPLEAGHYPLIAYQTAFGVNVLLQLAELAWLPSHGLEA